MTTKPASYRLVEAYEALTSTDQYVSAADGQWQIIPPKWVGQQAGAIFELPDSETLTQRSPIRLRGTVRRRLARNTRKPMLAMRAWLAARPVISGMLLLFILLPLLLLGGCSTYGPAQPYSPSQRTIYATPGSYTL